MHTYCCVVTSPAPQPSAHAHIRAFIKMDQEKRWQRQHIIYLGCFKNIYGRYMYMYSHRTYTRTHKMLLYTSIQYIYGHITDRDLKNCYMYNMYMCTSVHVWWCFQYSRRLYGNNLSKLEWGKRLTRTCT